MDRETKLGPDIVASSRADEEAAAYRRFEGRFAVFGALITLAAAGISLLDTAASHPAALRGASGLAIGALLLAFFVLYLLFLRGPDQPSPRRIAVHGTAQCLLVLLLQSISPNFFGLGIALAIQLMAVLPARLWLVPIIALVTILLVGSDPIAQVRRGNASTVALFAYQFLLWIAVWGFVLVLLRQRLRLAELVGDLRRAEAALRHAAAQAEELATLRERNRMAREMHDGLGHALVTVNVKLEAAERLYARDPPRGAAELQATRSLVREAMVGLRHSLDDLRTTPLPARELPTALKSLLAETRQRTGLATIAEIAAGATSAPPVVAETCWWLTREALRNVERHAAAGSVLVALGRRDGALVLRVADDGAGVAAADLTAPGHYGIVGMRERAEALGGSLSVRPRPGGGTLVEAILPLPVPVSVATNGAAPPPTPSHPPTKVCR